MKTSYIEVQAQVQQARRARSAALGGLLVGSWDQWRQRLGMLFLRRTARRFPWTETPV